MSMLWCVTPEIAEVERDVRLYDHLSAPNARIERWLVRRRRPISTAELNATAWALIEDLEVLASAPMPEIEIVVREAAPGEAKADSSATEEDFSTVNILLEALRRTRTRLAGLGGTTLDRALSARARSVAETYREALSAAVARLNEIERILVLYGAGSGSDAELAMGIIPISSDLPPGPSASFEL